MTKTVPRKTAHRYGRHIFRVITVPRASRCDRKWWIYSVMDLATDFVPFQGIHPKKLVAILKSHAGTPNFPRKCKPLEDAKCWEANKQRQLLCFRPAIFRRSYTHCQGHILLFSVYTSLLCHPVLHVTYKDSTKDFLPFGLPNNVILEKKELVYNVHNLMHLANDVFRHDPSHQFSCSPFGPDLWQ